MLHALPRRRRLRRPVLPVLLLTAATGAFAGLAVVPSAAAPAVDRLVALPAAPTTTTTAPPVQPDRDLRRASRSRTRVLPMAKPPAPAPVAAPPVKAPPVAPPKARTAPKKVVKPRSTARVAKAKVVTERAPESSGSGGRCPVPSASFTDTWGAARSGGRAHKGTDLLAAYGASVYAVADGVVDTTSSSNGGISLYLRADDGERYFYAHNSANLVSDGERVSAGDLIARVGSTGNAGNTNHVHFEREVGGSSVNPYRFVRSVCS